jgi:hypothetical protein
MVNGESGRKEMRKKGEHETHAEGDRKLINKSIRERRKELYEISKKINSETDQEVVTSL